MLDVRRLRVLREVAQTGSFSAAAESLAFTQPAVSRQIATLEAEAGTRLVERSARGVRLTQAGELLVGHADAILDRLTAAENQLEALNSLAGGRLHIGATATANSTLIPLAIRAFDAEFPEVELRLDEAVTSELIDRVAAGELDLAIVANPERYELPGEIVFFGTPAEERGSGKAVMIADGLFEGIDAALMFHPCDRSHVAFAPA